MRNLKKFLALMMAMVMALSLMVTVNAAEVKPSVEFTDVHNGDWFAPYVGYCANGLMIKCCADGSFGPNGYVTGYEALAMMMRAVGYDANNEFTGADWRIKVAT